jgi:hypothetical protein
MEQHAQVARSQGASILGRVVTPPPTLVMASLVQSKLGGLLGVSLGGAGPGGDLSPRVAKPLRRSPGVVKTSIGLTLDGGSKEVSKSSEWKAQWGQTTGSKPSLESLKRLASQRPGRKETLCGKLRGRSSWRN